jgi:RNA polymerase sigma-70 factor (ECF subfamily)
LLDRVRRRDAEAWRRLLHLYTPLVRHWCARWDVRGVDAEDVAQEVFQAVAAGIDRFHRDRAGDTFRGWLRGITRNKLLDFFRRNNQHPRAQGGTDAHRQLQEVPEPGADPDDSDTQLSALYHRALALVRDEFEDRTWQMFWRVVVDGRAPAAVAAEMDVTPVAVRVAKSRVLTRLRLEVGDLFE